MSPLYAPAGAALDAKVKAETRAFDAASGDVAYTGYGFRPTAVIILASMASGSWGWSIGFADDSLDEYCILYTEASAKAQESKLVSVYESYATKKQDAILKSLDTDGFTLTWVRTGVTGAGTIQLKVIAIK